MSALPPSLLAAHTPPPAPRAAGEISQRLRGPLDMVAGRARLLAILRAGFQWLVLATASWLILVLLLGSIRELPIGIAMAIAGLAWVLLFGGLLFFFRSAFRRHDLSRAARMVDVAVPETHERISSALELTQETDPRFNGSPELIAALVRQAEHAAEQLDPVAIVSARRVFYWFLSLIPILCVWLILLIVFTPTFTLGFQRLFQPWRAAAPLPTATLDVDPGNITKAQGDSVTINLAVTPVPSATATPAQKVDRAAITRRYAAGGANEAVTTDMEPTGNLTFRANIDNVQQTFSYRIAAAGAQSPTYTVTVQPRPAANAIQIDYAYPAYTHHPPHTDTARDGTIDALVGTTVTLTVDASQPLKSARLSITDNTPYSSTIVLAPVGHSTTQFTGQFTVRKSTDYRLQLLNLKELDNSDNQLRPIIARLDAPPQISITSPTEPALKVRPEDAIPLKYIASDDFGLTRIDLLTQADDRPPTVTALPVTPGQTSITGLYTLSVHDLAPGPAPKRITYQFRATDNRDPEPQIGLSMKQVLLIDRGVAPLAQRQDAQAAQTLGEAVQQASRELEDAGGKLDALRHDAAGRPLTDVEKQAAADARRDLANAAQGLEAAADKSSDSRLADAARQAKEIADQPIRQAQENTAASQLAADQPDARDKSLAAATQNIADARQKLDALSRDVLDKSKDQPLAHELERIAAEQQRLADALAQHPNDPALLQRQHQLQQDLDQVIKEHPELQKPAAAAAQAQADDLAKKLKDLQRAQQPLNQGAQSQQAAATVQDKLTDLAKQQEALNQKMRDFANQEGDAVKRAGGKPPDPAQLDQIPKDLQNRKLASAGQAQNAAAAQLDDAANQLENAQKRQQEEQAANQNAAQRAAQAASETAALQQQAQQLRQHIDDAQKNHDPPTRPSDPANQEATRLAEQVRRQAQQMAQSPANRQAAKQATDEADAAKRAAAQGDANSAQQHLATAAAALADAAQAQQPASPSKNDAQQATRAAAQARELAQEQRALANQSTQTDQSLTSAAQAGDNPQQSARRQQALADQMEQAAQSAKSLQRQTQGAAPELSQRAGQTAQSLQKAAAAQRAAAQATQSGDSSQAAAQQTQAAGALTAAQQSIGSPSGAASGQPGASDATAQAVQAARNAQSQAASGNPIAARQAAEQLSQASRQLLTGDSTAASASTAVPGETSSASGSPATPGAGSPGGASAAAGSGTGNAPGKGRQLAHTQSPAIPLPKSVQEIGLSPSDWARLPPNTQQQLLNSAQQAGPPAYRDMIKNYYSRIAHLDDSGGAP